MNEALFLRGDVRTVKPRWVWVAHRCRSSTGASCGAVAGALQQTLAPARHTRRACVTHLQHSLQCLLLVLHTITEARRLGHYEVMVGFDILLLLFLSYLPRYHLVVGVLVNITWDDSGPDPMTGATWTYMPSDQWNFGPTCSECTAKLDFSRVQNKTWHDATYQNTLQHVQIDFTGML